MLDPQFHSLLHWVKSITLRQIIDSANLKHTERKLYLIHCMTLLGSSMLIIVECVYNIPLYDAAW